MRTRLTLLPGANGTKGLVERYGDRLVCVRYRYDERTKKRIKTVELIEEESPWIAPALTYLVRIPYAETELRESVKRSGGTWNPEKKLWMVPRETVRRLSLESRVVAWLEPE